MLVGSRVLHDPTHMPEDFGTHTLVQGGVEKFADFMFVPPMGPRGLPPLAPLRSAHGFFLESRSIDNVRPSITLTLIKTRGRPSRDFVFPCQWPENG